MENHRTAIRNIRRDANESLKKLLKDKAISEDDEKRALDEIQKLTDGYMKKVDELSKAKEKEIRTKARAARRSNRRKIKFPARSTRTASLSR